MKAEEQKELLANLKTAHKAMGASLDRIAMLERALTSLQSDIQRLQKAFGPELKINWPTNNSWKDIPVKDALFLMETYIQKTLT